MSEPLAAASSSGLGSTGLAGGPKPRQLARGRDADVEAATGRGQVPVVPPQQVAAQLIGQVHPAGVEDRLGQAQRHGRVVGPLARLNLNGPPPTMSVIGVKVPGRLNSSVVPTASPQAKPTNAPTARSSAELSAVTPRR